MTTEFKICTQCNPHHVENCELCFGFGFYANDIHELVPISGGEIRGGVHTVDYIICPNCKGSPFGIEEVDYD